MQSLKLTLDSREMKLPAVPTSTVYRYLVDTTRDGRRFSAAPIFTPGVDENRFTEPAQKRRIGDDIALTILIVIGFIPLFIVMLGCVVSVMGAAMVAPLFKLANGMGRTLKDIWDRRAHVVLLRAHHDDNLHLRKGFFDRESTGRRYTGEHVAEAPFEETLYDELRFYGPSYALSPAKSDKLELGTPFFYRFTHSVSSLDRWQEAIFYRLFSARLVVVILGNAPSLSEKRWGLAWEIATLRTLDCPWKVLLIIPPYPKEEIEDRWNGFLKLCNEIGIRAPSHLPKDTRFVLFDENWSCGLVPASGETLGCLKRDIRNVLHDKDAWRSRMSRAKLGFLLGFSNLFLSKMIIGPQGIDAVSTWVISIIAGFVFALLLFIPRSPL